MHAARDSTQTMPAKHNCKRILLMPGSAFGIVCIILVSFPYFELYACKNQYHNRGKIQYAQCPCEHIREINSPEV